MQEVSIEAMMEVGAHFGHQTRRWNPKMRPYLFGARSGIHIIDLERTYHLFRKALKLIQDVVASGKDVLFVATKQQALEVIRAEAQRCGMPYIVRRWLGGLLTNFDTISQSVGRLIDLQTRRENNDFEGYKKKELLEIDREIERLEATLGGIKKMKRMPGALFIVDPQREKIAVHEANVLGIPVIALTDSNCDPDPIDYVVPANDDSLRSIAYFTQYVANICLAGLEKRSELAKAEAAKPEEKPLRKGRELKDMKEKGRAFVAKSVAGDVADLEGSDGSYQVNVESEASVTPADADGAQVEDKE